MKILLALFTTIMMTISCQCTIIQPDDDSDDSTISDSTEESLPIVDSIEVSITEATFTEENDGSGIYVRWVQLDDAVEYRIYYNTGNSVSSESEYDVVDDLLNIHEIEKTRLTTNIYTIAVTAVTKTYETSLENKQTLTYDDGLPSNETITYMEE